METGKFCFLIDDDLDDQEIFALALRQVHPSLQCNMASSAHEALAKLSLQAEKIPEYIFLDLNMPRMNGKECLKEIKKMHHLRRVPVVIYSTSSLKYDMTECMALGAADFIVKPFSMPELITVLTKFFEKERIVTT